MTTQTHSPNGTSEGHSQAPDADGRIREAMQTLGLDVTGTLLDQAQAIVAAATSRMDQAEATAKTERRKRDEAHKARKALLDDITTLDEEHRVAKADLVKRKNSEATKKDTAQRNATEAVKEAAKMKDLVARYTGVAKFITAERAPRNRSGS